MATEFFRKNVISYDTEISPQYADAYLGNESTIDVSGGNVIKKGIFQFKIADSPTFGTANLFRLKVGLHTNGIVQGKDEPRVCAYLMKNNLSDNAVGFEEGSLYLRNEEFLQIGSKPTMGTFWEESFDTDTTMNSPNATTVENLSGTVTRTADYAIFVEDLVKFINHEDITGGDKGWTGGWFDFEEFSDDFDEFMDDETQYVTDKEGMRTWLTKGYAIKSAGFASGQMESGDVDVVGWLGWDSDSAKTGATGGAAVGGTAGAYTGYTIAGMIAFGTFGAGLLVGGAVVVGFTAAGAGIGAVIGGVGGGVGGSWEEGVKSEWDGTPVKIASNRYEQVIMLNKQKKSGRHDRYVPKIIRGSNPEWYVHVVGYKMGGLDESGYIITNPVILQDVEVEGESGLLGEVTPQNSMALQVVTQEPQFNETDDPDVAELRSVGRVNFTKNNTLSGMNMLMKNVWNYTGLNIYDPTVNSPTLKGHDGPITSSGTHPPAIAENELGYKHRQETRVVYGKIPRPPTDTTSPGFPIGQNPNELNSYMASSGRNLMRYGNANQWAFSNSQGLHIEFDIYFDTMSYGWCESTHPEDIGPKQHIHEFDIAAKTVESSNLDAATGTNNPPGSDKPINYWTTSSEIRFHDTSSGEDFLYETEPVLSTAAKSGVITIGPNNPHFGALLTVDTITDGNDHTNGTYYDEPLLDAGTGTGTGARADITVSGNNVTAITITREGKNYDVNDALGIDNATIGGAADAACEVATVQDTPVAGEDTMHVKLRSDNRDTAMILSRRGFHVTLGPNQPDESQTFSDYMIQNLAKEKANYLLSFIRCGESNVVPERRNKINVLWQDSNWGDSDGIARGAPKTGRMCWLPHKGHVSPTMWHQDSTPSYTDIRWANLHVDNQSAIGNTDGVPGHYANQVVTLDTGKWYKVRLFLKPGLGHIVGDILDVSTGAKVTYGDTSKGVGSNMRDMQIGPGPGLLGGRKSSQTYISDLKQISTVAKASGDANDGTAGDKGFAKPPDVENITENSKWPNYMTFWNSNHMWNTEKPDATQKAEKDIWTGTAVDARDMQTKIQIDGIKIIGGNWDKDFATVDSAVSLTERTGMNIVSTASIATVGATTGRGNPKDSEEYGSTGPLAVIENGWSGTGNHLDRYHDYHSITTTKAPYVVSLGFNNPYDCPYMYDCTLESSNWTIDTHPTVTTQLGFADQGQTTDIDTDFFRGAFVINRDASSPTFYSAEITGYNKTTGALTVINILKADGSTGTRGSGTQIVTIVNDIYTLFNNYTSKDSSNRAKLTGDITGAFGAAVVGTKNVFDGRALSHWTSPNVNVTNGSTLTPTGVVTGTFGTNSTIFAMDGANPSVSAAITKWGSTAVATFDTSGTNFYFWVKPNLTNGPWARLWTSDAGATNNAREAKGLGAETVVFRMKIGKDASNYWWRDFTLSNLMTDGYEDWVLASVSLSGSTGGLHVAGTITPGTAIDYIEIDFNQDIKDSANANNGFHFYGGYLESKKIADVMATFSHDTAKLGVLRREDFITSYDKNFIAANEAIDVDHNVVGLTVGDGSKEVAIDFGYDDDDWTTTTAPDNASVSGFTTKGWVRWRFDASGQSVLDGSWGNDSPANVRYFADAADSPRFTKRENILSCARVLQVVNTIVDVENRNVAAQVIVDRPDVFSTTPKNTKFTIFEEGQAYGTLDSDNTTYRASNLEITAGDINGNQVEIRFNAGTDIEFLTDDNSNAIFIGPQMYWMELRVKPGAQSAAKNFPSRSYTSIACTSNPYKLAIDDNTNDELKSSDGSKKPIGPTYNENLWSNSNYANRWNMSLTSDYPAFIIDKDWGFGAASDEHPELGYCAQSYIKQNNLDDEYNEMEVNSIFKVDDKKPGDDISLIIAPLRESDHVEFNFDSSEGTNKPYMLTTFIDGRPTPPSLLLKLEPEAKDPTIMWANSDDDLWYGLLHVDNAVISSQYHNSVAYIPMDESLGGNLLYRFDQGDKFYFKYQGRTGGDAAGSITGSTGVGTPNVEGLAGYALDFTPVTNDSTKISSLVFGDGITSIYTEPTTYNHFTISLHITPDDDNLTKRWIVHQKGKFGIWLDSSNKVNARIYYQKGTGTIQSGTGRLQRDNTTTYYATHNGFPAPYHDTGSDLSVQTDAAHGLKTGDMLHISNVNAAADDYNGYYPHITVTNNTNLFCGPVRYNTAAFTPGTPPDDVVWTGFNYIDLRGSTSIPTDGQIPTHIALLVDAEAHNSNVSLYINGKIEDMTGKALVVGDSNHWHIGATLMKSNEKLVFGGGYDVEFGIAQHVADDLTDTVAGIMNYVFVHDSLNLGGVADNYWNDMLLTANPAATTDHTSVIIGGVTDSDADTEIHTDLNFTVNCNTNHTAGISDGSTSSVRHLSHVANTKIRLGLRLSGTGIPVGAYIVAINTATVFTMSADATATGTNAINMKEYMQYPWIKLDSQTSGGPEAEAGDKYSLFSNYSFDGKIEEICMWNSLVFPIAAEDMSFVHPRMYHLKELPEGNVNAGALTYNARLFMKDFHNIKGAKASRIATSNQLGWRKPSFSLNTT